VFLGDQHTPEESARIAGVVSGPLMRDAWKGPRNVDFFDIKGDVEALVALTGCADSFSFVAGKHPALHPGQCARIMRSGKTVGWVGMLHPALQQSLDLEQALFLFELELDRIAESRVPSFEKVSKFPATTRDLSILVDRSTSAAKLSDTIRNAGGRLLVDLELFDVYEGEGIPPEQRSLSYTLTLQESSRNLTDSEVEGCMKKILNAVEKKLDGKLRT
jgi:phenylalanyl-tRNA synthetase beta chain